MQNEASSVTELNNYIKLILDKNEILQNIYIIGEVSNFKHHFSGHIYFSLKDEESNIKCMMFSNCAKKLKFDISNGLKIFAYGYVSVYINSGQYQFYVYHIDIAGLGNINESLKFLYNKFKSKGFFDEDKKKALKRFPRKIGVITSKTGAVIHDISGVLKRRWPVAEIVLCSAKVQGAESPEQIVHSIKLLRKIKEIDVIILARGGGSTEDLWAFNDENVAKEIFKCNVPIVSAVGHNVDYTLCDYVADVRASTPSVAAELSAESLENVASRIKDLIFKCKSFLIRRLESEKFSVKELKKIFNRKAFLVRINEKKELVSSLKKKIDFAFFDFINRKMLKLSTLKRRINLFDSEAVLKKGYVLAISNKKSIIKLDDIDESDRLRLMFSDGIVEFDVKNVVKERNFEEKVDI